MGAMSKKVEDANIFEVDTPTVGIIDDDIEDDFTVVEETKPVKKAKKKADPFDDETALEVEEPEVEGIASLITDIDDKVEYLTWCIYGKNGTGKTTLLSTTDGMLVLAAEDGTLSIRDKSKGTAKKLRIDTWEKLEQVYWLLNEGTRVKDKKTGKIVGLKINVKGGTFIVKTVAIDTIDRLVEVCMRNVVLGEREKDADKDILKKTLKNWGDMGEKLKFWLQQFEELPVQRVYLCQEASNSEDVDADEFSIYPALNQSVRKYVLSEADIVARLYLVKGEKGQTTFKLSALPNSKYVTKDRTTKLSGTVTNPSLDKLYNAVFK